MIRTYFGKICQISHNSKKKNYTHVFSYIHDGKIYKQKLCYFTQLEKNQQMKVSCYCNSENDEKYILNYVYTNDINTQFEQKKDEIFQAYMQSIDLKNYEKTRVIEYYNKLTHKDIEFWDVKRSNNPYNCLSQSSLSFNTIDKVLLHFGFVEPLSEIRLREVSKQVFKSEYDCTYMYTAAFINKFRTMYNIAISEIDDFLCVEENILPVVKIDQYVTLESYYKMEKYIQKELSCFFIDSSVSEIFSAITDITSNEDFSYCNKNLSTEQNQCVQNAMNYKFSVITGGPGTGKTHIIKNLISNFEKSIFLAPTGTAAKNMMKSLNNNSEVCAFTLHSWIYEWKNILSFNNNKISHFQNQSYKISKYYDSVKTVDYMNDKDYDKRCIFVIDESSMIALDIFYEFIYLWINIFPFAHVVVVGDANQLPPVGVGEVFSNIIERSKLPCTKLTKVYRQEGNKDLLNAIYDIKKGKVPKLCSDTFQFVQLDTHEIFDYILKLMASMSSDESHGILCPTKKESCGVNELNLMFQNHFNKDGKQITSKFRINDKVVFLKNVENITNGSCGKIVRLSEDQKNVIFEVDDNTEFTCEVTSLHDHAELGYVITIHKSQGKQYDHVYIPLQKEGPTCWMLSDERRLLYTAVTRSIKTCTLLGSKVCFTSGCKATIKKRLTYLFKH